MPGLDIQMINNTETHYAEIQTSYSSALRPKQGCELLVTIA